MRIDTTKQICYNYTERQREIKWTRLSERIFYIDNKTPVAEREKSTEYYAQGIKVKVTYPDSINNTIRQQKINRIYDILLGANCRKEITEIEDSPAHLPKMQ